MQDVPTISRFELKERIDAKRPFTLVETLGAGNFAKGHLPGAINLPLDKKSRSIALRLSP